jgi:hypothetical protein
LVIPSSRAAVLVTSPIAVYSTRRVDPTCPDITGPVFNPTPILNPLPMPCSRSQALNRSSFGPSISVAAATARSA